MKLLVHFLWALPLGALMIISPDASWTTALSLIAANVVGYVHGLVDA